jgi:hypothetical protein
MAKRTPAPKSTRAAAVAPAPVEATMPMTSALVAPSPSLATPPRTVPRSFADWMMVPTYLMLSVVFVPVCWLTGPKKAK